MGQVHLIKYCIALLPNTAATHSTLWESQRMLPTR